MSMKIKNGFLNMMGFGDDEDDYEYYDDNLLDDDDDDDEDEGSSFSLTSIFKKNSANAYDDDDETDEVPVKKVQKTVTKQQPTPVSNVKPVTRQQKSSSSNRVVSMQNRNRGNEVYVIRPQEFNEAQTVTDFLKEGKTIVINMEGIELTSAQRIIDFIGGACYAIDGALEAVSSNIFIAAPSNVEVSGDLRDEILNESTVSPNLSKY